LRRNDVSEALSADVEKSLMRWIGFSPAVSHLAGRISLLRKDFAELVDLGCTAAEIPALGIDAVVGAKLVPAKVDLLRNVTEAFDLRYSVHAPNNLNLAQRRGSSDLYREMASLRSFIQLAAAIRGKVVVYHCGVRTGEEDEGAREQEVEALREIGAYARDQGVVVCVENTGSGIVDVIRQIEAVNSDSVRLALDLGHLFLADQTLGLDYTEEVALAAPWVGHIHINDNLGVEGQPNAFPVRIMYGETDLHLPPGWGMVPYSQAIAHLTDFEGLWILEVHERFRDHWSECMEVMKNLFEATDRNTGC